MGIAPLVQQLMDLELLNDHTESRDEGDETSSSSENDERSPADSESSSDKDGEATRNSDETPAPASRPDEETAGRPEATVLSVPQDVSQTVAVDEPDPSRVEQIGGSSSSSSGTRHVRKWVMLMLGT